MTAGEASTIIRECFPDLRDARIVELDDAGEWWKFLVGDRYVFRFPKFDNAAHGLRTEYAVLSYIRGKLPIATPDPIYYSENTDPSPLMGYPWIEGTVLSSVCDDFSDAEVSTLADQLGEFMTVLHSLPRQEAAEAFGDSGQSIGMSDFDDEIRDLEAKLDLLAEHLPDDIADGCRAVLRDTNVGAIEATDNKCLIHGDLWIGNILVDRNPIAVKGVVDWNSAAIHDPAWDFAELWWPEKDQFDISLRNAYGREVSPEFIRRKNHYLFAGNISGRVREIPSMWHRRDASPRRIGIWNEGIEQLRRLIPKILNQQEN